MLENRRSFFKKFGASLFGAQFLGTSVLGSEKKPLLKQIVPGQPLNVDQDLHFLAREKTNYPMSPKGYYSSYYKRVFTTLEVDPAHFRAKIKVKGLSSEQDLDFDFQVKGDRLYFTSVDHQYTFFWKKNSGFYAINPKRLNQIVELLHFLITK